MDRLLAFLFSVTLLLATSPPRESNEAYDCSGGICIVKESCLAKTEPTCTKEQASCQGQAGTKNENRCGDKSGCPLPICCVYGPCCCLCVVPERPVLHIAPPLPEEERVKPGEPQGFIPQQVYHSIWKPPAFSV
ncbi:MAG: hypothetical protein Q7T20_17220 [Saprospiraceae bacterium]|nr:hypothetical protein [Saprospiraceae bacterium]